jgi:hypothetical protein
MIDTSKEIVADILTEQFIPDHVFVYVARGAIRCYDGTRTYVFRAGLSGPEKSPGPLYG